MQFVNLHEQYQLLKSNIHKRINHVLEHGQYILGPEVKELEEKLADYVGAKYCITVANGTDALLLAMLSLGIQAGDEVITSPFTFIANGEMIALIGAKPVFVDIDTHTYNLDANKIAAAITPKTKCIMPISLFGQCADMHAINALAEEYHLPVIEDAAQSFGAMYHSKMSCNLSTIGTTSFFPSKPLGCYGDGGACFTNDEQLATSMRQIRIHGQSKRYHHTIIGMNSRLDTLQAAILLAKFTIFENEIEMRNRVADRYTRLLQNHVKTPLILPGHTSVYAQYTIQTRNRAEVQEYLHKFNIPTAIHYPLALHQQPVFMNKDYISKSYPIAEQAAKSVLSLPMHPYLKNDEQDTIIKHVLSALIQCEERAV